MSEATGSSENATGQRDTLYPRPYDIHAEVIQEVASPTPASLHSSGQHAHTFCLYSMVVGEVTDMSQRARSSSHGSLRQAVKREEISGNEFDNDDDQTPCTLFKLAEEPCLTSTRRSEDTFLVPSECTCNHEFFNIWDACLQTKEEMLPDFGEWTNTCRNHSLNVSEEYPSQWASRVTIPLWAVIAAASNSTFDVATPDLVPRASETAGIVPIVVPIASVLGLAALVVILTYLYWIKRGRNNESFGAFLRRCFLLRKAQEIRSRTRTSRFVIDSQPTGDADFVMINNRNDYIGGHSRNSSTDSLKIIEPEYHFPFKKVWRNSQIVQQFRRIPDIVPHPWGYRAVHIRPSLPGKRFRVDPSNSSTEESGSSVVNSRSGTAEGAIPDTIFEGDEGSESQYLDSYDGHEKDSLITDSERHENEVFLITNRLNFSTSVSSHSQSSASHQFKLVPPTPTVSSRSHEHLSEVIPPTVPRPRRPIDIPPAPQHPAPVPPGFSLFSPRRPSPLHDPAGPSRQPQPVVQPPHPPRSGSPSQPGSRNQSTPLNVQSGPSPPQTSNPFIQNNSPRTHTDPPQVPIPLHSGTPSQAGPPAPNAHPTPTPQPRPHPPLRRPSDTNDPQTQRRPMGARLPSSPRIGRRQSLEDEVSRFGPTVPSGDSILMTSPTRPPHRPLTPHSPHTHRRSLSGSGDDPSLVPALPPPRPTHARTLSSESTITGPDDNRLLYPGPVRAAGYNVNLPPDAPESLEVHGRPLPREKTHH